MYFFKRILPLFAGLLFLLACALPTAAVEVATPAVTSTTPTDLPLILTDTPNPTLPPTTVPANHLTAGQDVKITTIHMLDTAQGWAVGGLNGNSDHVLRTADGALTWTDITPSEPPSADPQAANKAYAFFLDQQHAWVAFADAVPSGTPLNHASIWRTADGGVTWQETALTEPALFENAYMPSDLTFVDEQHGWMMVHVDAGMNHDYFVLLATTDGGASWKTLIAPQNDTSGTQSCYKDGLVFITPQDGWMSVDCHGVVPVPYIFKSSDGGATWQAVQLSAPPSLPDIFTQGYCGPANPTLFTVTSGDLVLNCMQATTNASTPSSFLYETTDAGASWKSYAYPGGTLQFVTASTAFALGRDIQRSDDAGHSWTLVTTVNWDGQFSFVDANTVWAVATDNNQVALVKSTDGGLTWQQVNPKIAP